MHLSSDWIQSAYFAPNPDRILRWSTLLSPGRTFGIYLAHLPNACRLNFPPNRPPLAVRGAPIGLDNAHIPHFAATTSFGKSYFCVWPSLKHCRPKLADYFTCVPVFYPPPSGELPIRRASASDIVTTKSPLSDQAIMALRAIAGRPRLALKLKRRKLYENGRLRCAPASARVEAWPLQSCARPNPFGDQFAL